jgi:protein-S-isoprenylcysteine O-methyltransferase Ste14
MIARLFLTNTAYLVGMGALLFGAAGTLQWPGAWAFLITSAIIAPVTGLWLARTNPDLLRERMRSPVQSGQPAADKVFMAVIMLVMLTWLVAMGLEQRFRPAAFPLALQLLGFALYVASTVFIMWVFRENSFAAPVVKVQTERDHRVISTGPYAFVRHPMYGGVIAFFVGAPLMLSSWWGLAMVPLFIVLFAVRARIEERTLIEGLPGYADYAARVRYRLVPGLW